MIILLLLLVMVVFLAYYKSGGAAVKPITHFETLYSRMLGKKVSEWHLRERYQKINLKLGQRKLYFNELEFYNHIWSIDKKATVVYAGAASGHHTYFLARMFPDFKFHLWDPNEFHKSLLECPNVTIHNEYFTGYKGREKIYFLSDIRTGKTEKDVERDMELQMKWCAGMNIGLAMLKFRLPWSSGKTKYFDGKIYTQPRTGSTSTETRLWTDCKKIVEWDNDEYNSRIFYFQTRQRNAWYKMELPKIQGFDHCHDCWSEVQIADQYKKLGVTDMDPIVEVSAISRIDIPPHGLMSAEQDTHKKMLALRDITEKSFMGDNLRSRFQDNTENFDILSWYRPPAETPNFGILRSRAIYAIDKLIPAGGRPYFTRLIKDVPAVEPFPVEIYDACGSVYVGRGKYLVFVEFLTQNPSADVVVITDYVNPTTIPMLELFPERKFHFYFPFRNPNIEAPNLEIIFEYPSAADLQKWRGRDVVLIINMTALDGYTFLESAYKTNFLQYNICEAMKPKMAIYNINGLNSPILAHDGEVRIIPFHVFSRPVCVLVTDCKKSRVYPAGEIFQKYFNFSFNWRLQYYDLPFDVKIETKDKMAVSADGIDHCYDCSCEARIWMEHFGGDIQKVRAAMTRDTKSIRKPPHGMLPNMKDISKKIH
jgi:hypothetical protein